MKTTDNVNNSNDQGDDQDNKHDVDQQKHDRILQMFQRLRVWYVLHSGNMTETMLYRRLIVPYVRNVN